LLSVFSVFCSDFCSGCFRLVNGAPAGGRQRRGRVFGGAPTRGCLAKGKGIACAGCGRRAEHVRRRWRASVRAIAKWDTSGSRQVATKWCKMHGDTPTAHARRRVAAGQSRWLFCQCYLRGIRVFSLRDTGRRGAALVSRGGCTLVGSGRAGQNGGQNGEQKLGKHKGK